MKTALQPAAALQQTLSTRQQASLRILGMSAVELIAEARTTAEANPFLEIESEDPPPEAARSAEAEDDAPDGEARSARAETPLEGIYQTWGSAGRPADFDPMELLAAPESLREDLRRDAATLPLPEAVLRCLDCLIEELDDRGFLTTPLEELAQACRPDVDEPPGVWESALRELRLLEPAGIAQPGPSEAMAEELRRMAHSGAISGELAQKGAEILRRALDALARKDRPKLLEVAGDDEVLEQFLSLLPRLHPYPLALDDAERPAHILPDLIVRPEGSGWRVVLFSGAQPQVTLSSLAHDRRAVESAPLAPYYAEARLLVEAIHSRRQTLLRVAQATIDHQDAFLREGPSALKPLLQKDLAAELGFSESTVSRAAAGKHVLTPRGMFELQHFFSRGVSAVSESSEASTPAHIRALIGQWIGAEDPAAPLSDQQITDRLAGQGFAVRRRTVAKYREEAGFPSTRFRRRR